MKRKEFISTCSKSGLFVLGGGLSLLHSCMGSQFVAAEIIGSEMIVNTAVFKVEKNGASTFKRYIIASNDRLQYPICIYRLSDEKFQALLMRCTHQGTELQVFGDRLQCPAHGSEFTISGAVQNGPAETSLRTFPVHVDGDKLKINLA